MDFDELAVRELHTAYLKKIVDSVNDLDNVLYEVINERRWKGLGLVGG